MRNTQKNEKPRTKTNIKKSKANGIIQTVVGFLTFYFSFVKKSSPSIIEYFKIVLKNSRFMQNEMVISFL